MLIVGTVGIVSCHGRFLESYDNGEMHAGKVEQGEAESWILWQIDWLRHEYALQNLKSHKFLSKCDVKCVVANKDAVGITEKWAILKGDPHHVPGRIAFRAYDGTIMGSHAPGVFTGCGGEIMAADRPDPSVGANNQKWPGWCSLQTTGKVVVVEDGLAEAVW